MFESVGSGGGDFEEALNGFNQKELFSERERSFWHWLIEKENMNHRVFQQIPKNIHER